MSSYEILPYSYKQAKKLGVSIAPSKNKNKKIDVYKDGQYIFAIGDVNYNDYPTYLETKGEEYANKRRTLYHNRHKKDDVPNTRGWYTYRLLW
jgi:hypothetical protein